MNRLSIVHRLYMGFGFLCLVILGWGLVNGWMMQRIGERIATITEQAYPLHQRATAISSGVLGTTVEVMELVQAREPDELERRYHHIEQQNRQLRLIVGQLDGGSLSDEVGELRRQLQRLEALAGELHRSQRFRLDTSAQIQNDLSDFLLQASEMKRQISERSLQRAARDIYTADLVRTLMQRFSSVELLVMNLVNTRRPDQLAEKVERIRFNSANFSEDIADLVTEVPALVAINTGKQALVDNINSEDGIVSRYLAYRHNEARIEEALEEVRMLIDEVDLELNRMTDSGEAAILGAGRQLDDEARNSRRLVWLLLPVVLLLALAVSLLLGRLIRRPLHAIVSKLGEMAAGDYRGGVSINATGEFVRLTGSVGQLLVSMQAILGDLRSTADTLSQLSGSNRSVSVAVRERLERQAMELESVASAMAQVESAVEEVNGKTERSQALATTIDRDVDRSQQLMLDNLRQVSVLEVQMTEATGRVAQLAASSEAIGGIVQTIDAIAGQTNLLALNAAIEAARAGERGRGFAVVADEVRNLARRTSESTGTIRDLVESLQLNASEAVDAMADSRAQLLASRQLIEQASSAVDEIRDSTTCIRGVTEEVGSAMNEQRAVATSAAGNVNVISTVARENFQQMDMLAQQGERLQRQLQGIEQLIRTFRV
ncbi:methyl-accepting chemotaxis protein [Marinobacterium aestuariivivens]|uniref:Methyl-accepting chemotaxis protein n=1 Tax=Marinobacterium aestuariivivens TaxID=1698799 RepID=A0ABW1ZUI7_9GAMM